MNLASILKMLGVKLTPEAAAQIQALIPQIPGKVNELIAYNVAAVKSFDQRLKNIEETLERIEDAAIGSGKLQRTGRTDSTNLISGGSDTGTGAFRN